ncbi:hypothetical protein [Pseudomonas typographi]|uniref:hypothetical protein n=1 Tax=Pseudomonas typographi TaxID=2715964 RepID=UPI00168786A9|nr:hypothetical protein [Pseudomonas typographi]MBD1587380.1 hypothetical protein [Pseudomonas typographi]
MSKSKPVPMSQSVRDSIAQQYRTGATLAAGGPLLTVADDVHADKARGILKVSAWAQGLEVIVQPWENGFPIVTLIIEKKSGSSGWQEVYSEEMFGGLTAPFHYTIPIDDLIPDGTLEVRGTIDIGERYDGEVTTLVFDSTPPYRDNPAGRYPTKPSIVETIITQAYLDANGSTVKGTVPGYPDHDQGDQLFIYLEKELPEPGDQLAPVWHGAALATATPFEVTEAALQGKADGEYYLVYILVDVAGNYSEFSWTEKIDLLRDPLPVTLAAPNVPAADPTIDVGDIRSHNVSIEIEPYTGARVGDWIAADWDGDPFAETPVPPTLKTVISVASDYFVPVAGQQTTADVAYQVRRLRWQSTQSAIKSVAIDLRVPGPENPGWPGPNPDLDTVTFRSASGAENVVGPADIGQDGTLEFEIYEDARVGEIMRFYWDGREIGSGYTVEASDNPGEAKTYPVPWADQYLSVGQDEAQVHYRIFDPGLPEENYQQSEPTAVDTSALPLTLPQMTAPDAREYSGFKWLYCSHLKDPANPTGPQPVDSAEAAIRIWIPDVSVAPYNLGPGETLTLYWKTFLYEDTGLPEQPGSPITPDGEFSETHTLAPGEEKGFFWYVPYEPYGRVTAYPDTPAPPQSTERWAWAQVHYTAQVSGKAAASAPTDDLLTVFILASTGCYAETLGLPPSN